MPLATIRFKPGIDLEMTQVLNMAGWSRSNLIRFRQGMAEKLGGWLRVSSTALTGSARGMHAWADLNGTAYIAVGTNQRLEVFVAGNFYDITPAQQIDNIPPNFSTIAGSSVVTINDPGASAAAGNEITIVVPVAVGGLVLLGNYTILTAGTQYTIQAAGNAAFSINNGGQVPIFFGVSGQPLITVTLPNHGLSQGGTFTVQVATTVGGITLLGGYTVTSVLSSSTFTIAPGQSPVALSVAAAVPVATSPGSGFKVGDFVTLPAGDGVATAAVLKVTQIDAAVASAVPQGGSAGSGYAAGDTLTMPGGSGVIQPAVLTVLTVSGGAIATLGVITPGQYTVIPTNPVTPASTSGAGMNAKVNLTMTTGRILTVAVQTPGLYTAPLVNPVAMASTSGVGVGAEFNLTLVTSSQTVAENGGNARIYYLINAASADATLGAGLYGSGNYGGGVYGAGDGSNIVVPLRQWFLDNWGQDLVGNFTNSTFYYWQPPVNVLAANIAQAITGTDVPATVNSSFVAEPEQILVALGCNPPDETEFDPNEVRWCDVADFTDWIATATNQAGSFRIPTGSRIVGGLQAPLFGCIWTDVDLWLMQYLGAPLVFGFTKIRGGQGLLAARAAAVYATMVFSASKDNFFQFDGNTTQILPCPVWDQFFKNINLEQVDKVCCGVNSLFGEVWWFYPSLNSTEVDSYVKYSAAETQLAGTPIWDYGSLVRLCWQDVNPYGNPLGVDGNGLIQQHEIGTDEDVAPMGEFITSGYAAIAEGDQFMSVGRMLPDFKWSANAAGQQVSTTIGCIDYPDDAPVTLGPYVTTQGQQTYFTTKGARGRGTAFTFGSSPLGTFWRIGAVRYLAQSTGRR